MKVVINACFGGFGLSPLAVKRLAELNGRDDGSIRTDPKLIQVVEELGDAANGQCAKLEIVEIPDGTDYEIEEHGGNEHIAEKHRTWRTWR